MKPKCDACDRDADSVVTFICSSEHARSFVMCKVCATVVILGHVQGRNAECARCDAPSVPAGVHPVYTDIDNGLEMLCEAARADLAEAGVEL